MNLEELTAVVVVSYLIGSIPMGYLLGKVLRGVDIRDYGSGSIGATNVYRTLGRLPFLAVMLLDAAKGYFPVLAVWYIFGGHDLQVASGIAAVIGHDFPVYIHFRGGRGVATSFGVYAALALPLAIGLFAVGVFILFALRYMSVTSMVTVPLGALVLLTFAVLDVSDEFTYTKAIFGGFATAFVLVTHIENIKRLLKKTEPKFGEAVEGLRRHRRKTRPRTT